jgi:hypothetical protein
MAQEKEQKGKNKDYVQLEEKKRSNLTYFSGFEGLRREA